MSIRRNIRLRKEYLYRKSLEGKEKERYEKKQIVREALQGIDVYLVNLNRRQSFTYRIKDRGRKFEKRNRS